MQARVKGISVDASPLQSYDVKPMSSSFSLLRLIFFSRWRARLFILATSLAAAVFGVLAPFFQKEFVDHLTGQKETPVSAFVFSYLPIESAWPFIVFAFLAYLLSQGFTQWTNLLGFNESIRMQAVLAEKLYAKTLSLKMDTLSQKTVGEIVTLYATDIPGSTVFLDQTLPTGATTVFPLIIAPFVLILLFDTPLWPTLIAIGLVTAINTFLAFRQSKFFYLFKQLASERIGLVSEWVQNIRALRVLGWTAAFEKEIQNKRIVETVNRVRMVTNGQVMNSISSSFTFILNILTLGVLVATSKASLTSGEILALLWILGVFLTRPFRQMPWFFTFGFDAWTSTQRLAEFFQVENQKTTLIKGSELSPLSLASRGLEDSKTAISASAALEIHDLHLELGGQKRLDNIHLKVLNGEWVAIVGEVGSGKSLLLLSLLGETGASWSSYKIHGEEVEEKSTVWKRQLAFVPQEGFIISASLRDNVIFDYDQPKSRDFEVLGSLENCEFHLVQERSSQGLDTEVGERGVNLSGGQKQRISLARVDFNSTSLHLLDDCLSAVDVDTEKKLVENLLLHRWKKKTRMLVTHRLSVLNSVDRILFLEQGRIADQGTYQELLHRSASFREFTRSVQREQSQENHD